MSKPSIGTQTAAERKAAEAELATLVEKFCRQDKTLFNTVRRRVLARVPGAHEIVYEYRDCVVVSISPSEHGYEGVFAIRADAKGVHLYFNAGATLPDPEKLLKGTGKLVRFIDVESAATLEHAAVVALMNEAIARSSVKFGTRGQGSIAVRLTTAKKATQKTKNTPPATNRAKASATVNKKTPKK